MTVRTYNNLNLDRETIEATSRAFIEHKTYSVHSIGPMPGTRLGLRVVFAKQGDALATVNIFYNRGGTSTVQYQTGANHNLGKELADHLYETINPAEFEHVNMVLQGFVEQSVLSVLQLSAEQPHIQFNEYSRNTHTTVWKVYSLEFQDELTVSLHHRTGTLQIQGRPLSCYRVFTFNLSELLDLQGLEKVLIRQDDGKASIVQKEVARSHLECEMGNVYPQLHANVEKLLVSGLCVKLAAPDLPDYCMLLYPELRSVEGVLKSTMHQLGMPISQDGFGPYFDKIQGRFILKPQFAGNLVAAKAQILNDAYTFFNTERHGLFHMETVVDASRMISDMARLMVKARRAWGIIKDLYIV